MNRLTSELEERINNKVKETVDKLNTHFKMNMDIPPVYYDVIGTTAGIAKYRSMSVHLNTKLLLNNLEDSIENTVPHEVCHLATYYKHCLDKRPGMPKAHGASWKLMMWVAGANARRTHDYDVEEISTKKIEYLYKCGCESGIKVSKIRHNKIKSGHRYKCVKCNKEIHSGERIIKHGFSTPSPNGTTVTRESD